MDQSALLKNLRTAVRRYDIPDQASVPIWLNYVASWTTPSRFASTPISRGCCACCLIC